GAVLATLTACTGHIENRENIFTGGGKKDIETNTPSENPEGVGQLNRC
ncbi:DUF4223 family protein, partial [Escherichia sp. SS-MK2]